MRRALTRRKAALWTLATAFGMTLGAVAAELVGAVVVDDPGLHNIAFTAAGGARMCLVGLCVVAPVVALQYLALRPVTPDALRWVKAAMLGGALGVFAGSLAGLAGAIWGALLGFALSDGATAAAIVALPAGGAAAGGATGCAMGALLRAEGREWSQEWTAPLSGAWAASGAVYWALHTLLAGTLGESGILDAEATPQSVALAALIGLAAGLVGGVMAGRRFARAALG